MRRIGQHFPSATGSSTQGTAFPKPAHPVPSTSEWYAQRHSRPKPALWRRLLGAVL